MDRMDQLGSLWQFLWSGRSQKNSRLQQKRQRTEVWWTGSGRRTVQQRRMYSNLALGRVGSVHLHFYLHDARKTLQKEKRITTGQHVQTFAGIATRRIAKTLWSARVSRKVSRSYHGRRTEGSCPRWLALHSCQCALSNAWDTACTRERARRTAGVSCLWARDTIFFDSFYFLQTTCRFPFSSL